MDFEWSQEQELLRASVRRFAEERAPLGFVREHWDDPAGVTPDVWSGLADLGATGLLIPEAFGGAGLGLLDMGVVVEELGRALFPGPVLSSALVATRLLMAACTDAERRVWLPPMAAGARRAAVALDAAEVRASRSDRRWELSGGLAPVLDAFACETLLVPVPLEGSNRVFAVDTARAATEAFDSVDGTRRLFRVALDSTPATLLGDGPADGAVDEARDLFAIGLATDAVGAAARALELAVAYASDREQFGRPIGSFQSIQHLLVDRLQDIELARAAVIHALWAADAAAPAERTHAVAIAKAFAAEALPAVGQAAIQVFGGIGFTWEMDIHLFDKRLCSQAILGGDAAHHLEVLAARVLDRQQTQPVRNRWSRP